MKVPQNAKVELQVRIVGNKGNTDWQTFGTFFTDFRRLENNHLALECYDSMLYAEQPFLQNGETREDYPIFVDLALQRISDAIGVPLDPRNEIAPMDIPYPQNFFMREVLGFIASANGGNFCITDDNTLRLVVPQNDIPLYSITTGTSKRITESDIRQFDSLEMTFNDNGNTFKAGGGKTTLNATNFFATQEITDHAYNAIKGYKYTTFEAESADIDPALELGDSIEISGTQANLWVARWNTRLHCDVSIPTAGDTSREFPFYSKTSGTAERIAESAQDARDFAQETFEFAQSISDSIIKIDHLPKQAEIDTFPDDSVVLVYDTNNPFVPEV